MSKSSIKNVNNLNVLKKSYLDYNDSQYEDLLFRLNKKSVWWSINTINTNSFILTHKSDSMTKFFYKSNYLKRLSRDRIIRLKYNPFSSYLTKKTEFFFNNKIKIK